MFHIFSATDPINGTTNYLLTQGVLGVACLVLGLVIVYQQRKSDKKDETHAAEVRALYAQLIAENKQHASDYRELAKDNQEVLQGNSQANQLLVAKIEAVKGR